MTTQEEISVLLVEDDFLVSEAIDAMLSEAGYTVVRRATDGDQALAMMVDSAGTSSQPDLVLMDIEMPGLGGIETTRLIQERCPTPVVARW